jgi:hypothetical protein
VQPDVNEGELAGKGPLAHSVNEAHVQLAVP